MKTRAPRIALALLLLSLGGTAAAQEQNRFLSIPAAELARTWLLRNCGITEEPLLESAIVQRAGELAPVLTRAWEDGPDEALVEEASDGARRRFARNRAALDKGGNFGLSPENARRVAARSADDFVARAVQSLETGYRGQALRGLYLGGSEQGRRLVQELAERKDPIYGDTARLLLEGER